VLIVVKPAPLRRSREGRLAADYGLSDREPSTLKGVMLATPWTESTSAEAAPAVPNLVAWPPWRRRLSLPDDGRGRCEGWEDPEIVNDGVDAKAGRCHR